MILGVLDRTAATPWCLKDLFSNPSCRRTWRRNGEPAPAQSLTSGIDARQLLGPKGPSLQITGDRRALWTHRS